MSELVPRPGPFVPPTKVIQLFVVVAFHAQRLEAATLTRPVSAPELWDWLDGVST